MTEISHETIVQSSSDESFPEIDDIPLTWKSSPSNDPSEGEYLFKLDIKTLSRSGSVNNEILSVMNRQNTLRISRSGSGIRIRPAQPVWQLPERQKARLHPNTQFKLATWCPTSELATLLLKQSSLQSSHDKLTSQKSTKDSRRRSWGFNPLQFIRSKD